MDPCQENEIPPQENMDFQLQPIEYQIQDEIIVDQPPRTASQQQQFHYTNVHENSQCDMRDLLKRINKETELICQMTGLNYNFAMLLYHYSKWSTDLCTQYTMTGLKQKQKIGYLSKQQAHQQGPIQQGYCEVCEQPSKIIMVNICGHAFCADCWVSHMLFRLHEASHDPFPMCMQLNCGINISQGLCTVLCEYKSQLKNKYQEVLCRSYATWNKTVKMCKGRPGYNCSRCFLIYKMYAILQCESCGNLVCPRCGQRSHGPSICDNVSRWNILQQTTMGLVQYYQYQKCPKCKNGVERSAGCNQITCRCKHKFCYICGDDWDPTHPTGQNAVDYCPNYRSLIKTYRERKQKRKKNIIKFCFNIQAKRQQLSTIDQMYKQIEIFSFTLTSLYDLFRIKFLYHESELKILAQYCLILKKTLCLLWGETLAEYFSPDQKSKFFCGRIKEQFRKIYQFVVQFVNSMYKLLIKAENINKNKEKDKYKNKDENKEEDEEGKYKIKNKDEQLTQEQTQAISIASLRAFYQKYFEKVRALSQVMVTINKIAVLEFEFPICEH